MDSLKQKQKGLIRGISEEEMSIICKWRKLTPIETKVMVLYYCNCLKLWQIGNELNYSQDNISKIKRRALDKF
jgi:DNA-directed RNA polymerase specialized sigma subunit